MNTRSHLTLVLTCLMACAALAAENEALITLAYPVKFAQTPIQVDGKLTPQEWDAAVRVSGFRLSGSEALAPEQTVMQLLYDQQNLYLGVKCAESQMDKLVVKCLMDDGDVWHDDCIEFFMDAAHDHATYWQFIVNPAATRYDAAGFDRTWNCNWKAAASKEANAWFIEVAIPFKELKTPTPTSGAVWGFNIARERRAGIGGKLQLYNWADVQGNFHRPTLYGHLWFVGRDWQPSEQDTAAAAKRAGGKEARLYVPGGCWIVQEGQKPKAWTYRDLLATQQGVVTRYLDDLSDLYKRHPRAALRSDFDALTKRYQEVKQLAAGPGPADPEACAAAKVFLDGLEGKASDLYWRVRIELLNETF